ncbi:helix-turn-helix domain-containing protein [Flexivirga sp. B27]
MSEEEERRQSIGATVKTLREAQGLSRQDLCLLTGSDDVRPLSVEMLAKIEQGRKAPSATTLKRLAVALGIDAPDLSQRASAWQFHKARGADDATLRAGTVSGALGQALGAAAVGALVTPAPILAAATTAAVHRRRRGRKRLEAALSEALAKLPEEQLEDFATELGVDVSDPAD